MKILPKIAIFPVLISASLLPTQRALFAQTTAQGSAATKPVAAADKGDAYYYFALGHLQDQEYEASGSSDTATSSINDYKKALELEPGSTVIMESLAEIYAKSQHIRDAVVEAQEVLKADPNDVSAHRLLARIYVATLGDVNAGEVQQENLQQAVEQFEAILKLRPDDTYSALWLARLYRFQNHPDKAEKTLRDILQQDSQNGAALEQLSRLLIDEGRSKEASDLLAEVAEDASSPDIYDLLGNAYLQDKNFSKAADSFQKAINEDPDDAGHHKGLAQALMSEEKYTDALEQYKKLAELEPGTSDNYLRMAQIYRKLGQYDLASSSLAKADQLAPGNLEVLYNEALLDDDEGHYSEASKVLTDAIAGVKNQTGSEQNTSALGILYEQLGHVYIEQANYPAAIDAFQELGKLGADNQKRAQILLIDAYRQSHDLDRAITETSKALVAAPQDPELTETLAELYGEKGNPSQATKLLQTLLHGDATDGEIYVDISQVQQRGHAYGEAEQSAQKAEQLAKDPSDQQTAWFMLGSVYDHEKKFDLAEQEFRKVLDQNPDNAPVLNYYAYMLADRGQRLDEAITMVQRAVKQDPNNGAYLDSLGWVYYKQNRFAEAEEYLRKAVDRLGTDPTILSHLGDVYIKLGENERAADLLERSLAQWQKQLPVDYEQDKVNEVDAKLKTLKRHLAQKSSPEVGKPQ
jgi:tetratricopeptide (TPR) repeat protein